MISRDHFNPLGVDLARELPATPQALPNWTEYWFISAYDPQQGYGIYIHIGREVDDPTVFTGSVAVYLPDGEMMAAHYRGRDGHARGPGAGPLRVSCIEPGQYWTASFDGPMHRTTRQAITSEVLKDAPVEMVRFDVRMTGMSPLWDLEKAELAPNMRLVTGEESRTEKKEQTLNHWEQVCAARGEISIGGRTVAIEGAGMRDHSFGPRDYSAILGSHWFNGLFPSGKCFMMMTIRVGANHIHGGFIYRNDGSPIEVIRGLAEHPEIGDADTPDGHFIADPVRDPRMRDFTIRFQSQRGLETIEGQTVHAMATTQVRPAHELVGTDLTRTADALQMCDCPTVLRWDGEDGAGLIERIIPIAKLRVDD